MDFFLISAVDSFLRQTVGERGYPQETLYTYHRQFIHPVRPCYDRSRASIEL